jgi:uncharacterized protein YggE
MNRKILFLSIAPVLAGCLVSSGCGSASAQPVRSAPGEPGTLAVSGSATVTAKPDFATMLVGTSAMAPTASSARAKCDTAMRKVQAALRKAGVREADMQTVNFTLMPVKNKNQPLQWKVIHKLGVKIAKVDLVASAADAAISSGASDVSSIEYGIESPAKYRSQAREKAVAAAKEKARELAGLMGVTLGRVRMIAEDAGQGGTQWAVNYRFSDSDWSDGARLPSPLQGGRLEVDSTANVVFEIEP